MALQPRVDLGLLYDMPPSLSIPYSVPPFVYPHSDKILGIQIWHTFFTLGYHVD